MKESYRDQRGLPVLETLWLDLRYACRMLRKYRGFTSVAVITLALGIGANTAIFSLINAVILRSLPIYHPEELVELGRDRGTSFSYPTFEGLRDRNEAFSGMLAVSKTKVQSSKIVLLKKFRSADFGLLAVRAIARKRLGPRYRKSSLKFSNLG